MKKYLVTRLEYKQDFDLFDKVDDVKQTFVYQLDEKALKEELKEAKKNKFEILSLEDLENGDCNLESNSSEAGVFFYTELKE
jgi:hypothetical protein